MSRKLSAGLASTNLGALLLRGLYSPYRIGERSEILRRPASLARLFLLRMETRSFTAAKVVHRRMRSFAQLNDLTQTLGSLKRAHV